MTRTAPKLDTLRKLFALSGNQCAFPGCKSFLVSKKGIYIGQICHIEAANKGGERYNPKQTEEQRRAFKNLLLLCYEHHQETNDVKEFTVQKLKQIKKDHEKQFIQSQFPIPETEWVVIASQLQEKLDKLYDISKDTNQIVHELKDQLQILTNNSLGLSGQKEEELYIEQLDSIKDLKKQNKQWTAVGLLENFRTQKWDKISEETKYKIIINLGMIYLELNEIQKAGEVLFELENIAFDKDERFALLALACSVKKDKRFRHYFHKAKERTPNNTNLWVAYANYYSAKKDIGQIINNIPISIRETPEILFSLSSVASQQNNDIQSISYIRQSLENFHGTKESKADIQFVLATRLLIPLTSIYKVFFNHYTDQEKANLQEAIHLFTQAWSSIKDTELVKSKWQVLLNRGTAQKIMGNRNDALIDFFRAYEISGNFLVFENLVILLLQMSQFSKVDEMIAHYQIQSATPEEQSDINAFKVRSLHLQNKTQEAVDLLLSATTSDNDKERNRYSLIVGMFLEHHRYKEALPYAAILKEKYPDEPEGYILSGTIYLALRQTNEAKEEFIRSIPKVTKKTAINEKYELADGLIKLQHYEEAAVFLEQIVDWQIFNNFSRGLIYAWYQSGNIEKAMKHATVLYQKNQAEPFLAEIVLRIYEETKLLDRAIEVGKDILSHVPDDIKYFFQFRIANIYFKKKDWVKVKEYCISIQSTFAFSMDDIFRLAFLMVKTGEIVAGMELAYQARKRFFNISEAHAKFITVALQVKEDPETSSPKIVKENYAVILEDSSGKKFPFIITSDAELGMHEIAGSDDFVKQLLGKEIHQEVYLNQRYGGSATLIIKEIINKHAYVFRESMDLFSTRFANNNHNIHVFNAIPGQSGDEFEAAIRKMSIFRQSFQKQLYQFYEGGLLTVGMLAGLFKQNFVIQFFSIASSPNAHFHSYTYNQKSTIEKTVHSNTPIVLDITILLSTFMLFPDNDVITKLTNLLLVAQSTIEELQDFYDELEVSIDEGYHSIGYAEGEIVTYSIEKDHIQNQRARILDIIDWCQKNTTIVTPNLIGINRTTRIRFSEMLGEYTYHTILVANEYHATVATDDAVLQKLLLTEHKIESISTYQAGVYFHNIHKISTEVFTNLTLGLIKANFIFIPPTETSLWQCFEFAGCQLRKPFTVAIRGLLILKMEYCVFHSINFLKTLYLSQSLATTKQQASLYLIQIITKHKDYENIKKQMRAAIQEIFRLLPQIQDELLQLLNLF